MLFSVHRTENQSNLVFWNIFRIFTPSIENLFEKCEFNLLTRKALGMELLTDVTPSIESLPLEEQHKRNNVEAAMFQYSFHTRNGKTRYRGLLKHRMHAYSRCMWMNLRRMVIFQISTFQRTIFALFGPIRETFGSFMAISRRMFTSGADCYVSLRMTTLVMLDSKYAPF